MKYIQPISQVRKPSEYTNINHVKDVATRQRLIAYHALAMLNQTKLTLASYA